MVNVVDELGKIKGSRTSRRQNPSASSVAARSIGRSSMLSRRVNLPYALPGSPAAQSSAQNYRRRKLMKKIFIHVALSAVLFALCSSADAQQPTKVPRIGFLLDFSPPAEGDRSQALPRGCSRDFDQTGQRARVKRGGTRRRSVQGAASTSRRPKDIETAFRAASKGCAEAVLVLGGPSPFLSENSL